MGVVAHALLPALWEAEVGLQLQVVSEQYRNAPWKYSLPMLFFPPPVPGIKLRILHLQGRKGTTKLNSWPWRYSFLSEQFRDLAKPCFKIKIFSKGWECSSVQRPWVNPSTAKKKNLLFSCEINIYYLCAIHRKYVLSCIKNGLFICNL